MQPPAVAMQPPVVAVQKKIFFPDSVDNDTGERDWVTARKTNKKKKGGRRKTKHEPNKNGETV
jgi:hypothetical protein